MFRNKILLSIQKNPLLYFGNQPTLYLYKYTIVYFDIANRMLKFLLIFL